MKLLFLCGSLEPGKDGVGDYTRRLCGELVRRNHQVQIIALCDKHVEGFIQETQCIDDIAIPVGRISSTVLYQQRLSWTLDILDKEHFDWISLQYVPYSFHPKGLPYWLPEFLSKIKGTHRWHFMFHETWLGIDRYETIKKKYVGFLQKRVIRKLQKSVTPKVVHTQSKVYQHYLSKIGIESHYLPLFGNVAVTGLKNKDAEFVVMVIFATIHDNTPFQEFISDLKLELQKSQKKVKFVFIGRHGDLLDTWTTILQQNGIEYELLGPSSEDKISRVLINGDYGISTTPFKISDKSGVVAAMREHQLPIVSVAKAWVDQDDITISFKDIINYQKGALHLNNFLQADENSLSEICNIFLKNLSNN